jgi:hypothetical protein
VLLNWLSQDNSNIVSKQYGALKTYVGQSAGAFGKFTDDFIAAATASFRCPKAMVEVTWADSAVDENMAVTWNDVNRINRTGQLFNGKTESGQKWAYLHSGLIADGTFKAMPELDSDQQMGWYGFNLTCDGSGIFSTKPWIKITHDARSYSAVLVSGDSQYNEYPVDFTLTFVHAGGPTVIPITGNTERVYSSAITLINDVTSVKLEISKWSEPNTIVKITQFSGSLIEIYKSNEIVELNILEETNSDTGVVPIGNVSANELDLSLLNTERRFSYGNTDSPYNTSLRSGRKIRVWLGFVLPVGSTDQSGDVVGYIVETVSGEKIGYMPYGVYWSKDWISSYESQITTTTAYDVAYLLSQKEFLKSDNYTGTVQSIVDAVLTIARTDLPDLNWSVSADTAGITWDNVAFEPKNYLDILKDIAEATLSYTYVDRNGILIVGARLVANIPLENWQKVGLSEYYNFKSDPKLNELINRVRIGYTKYNVWEPEEDSEETVATIYSDDEIFTIPASGVLNFYIAWRTSPVDISTVVVALAPPISGMPLISDLESYAYGANVEVTGDAGDTFQLSGTGIPYELEENTETTAQDSNSIAIYGIREFALTGNSLITSVNMAQTLAIVLVNQYGNLRQDGSMQWPASTLLSVGDTLEVIEFKSDTVETKDNFLIKRQSIKYDGSMQGQTELRRG